MTGTASSRGGVFSDFDSYKNEEWLRRRKLRLEQVRKQSNDIARVLRSKVINEERARTVEHDRIRDTELRQWKIEKLDEWEKKLNCALEEFGTGHKLAEEEPDPKEVIEMRNKINLLKAYERGEIAKQEELKRKKLEEEEKMSHIHRKKMTRKIEDLRSALIRSVLVQKQLLDLRDKFDEKIGPHPYDQGKKDINVGKQRIYSVANDNIPKGITNKKVLLKKTRKKRPLAEKIVGNKIQISQHQNNVIGSHSSRLPETAWVNLDDLQLSSRTDTEKNPSSRRTVQSERTQTEKTEKSVVFYDYRSRYNRKTFVDFPNLVEKINSESEPNANELAKIDVESKQREAKKKPDADVISQERGLKALQREKISRDYYMLIAKLEDLNKKEKIIKAQQRIPPSLVHLNDERLSERTRTRQKIMETKFENIYHEATCGVSIVESYRQRPLISDLSAGGDCIASDDRLSTKLSFSPSNLKTNSPVTPTETPTSPIAAMPRPKVKTKKKKKKKLLSDIDKTLREGRELRETISRNWEQSEREKTSEKSSDVEEDKYASTSETETIKPVTIVELVPKPSSEKAEISEKSNKGHDRESQTENFINSEKVDTKDTQTNGLFEVDSKIGDDSLAVSTSTSYKSPPSVMGSCKYRRFLDYLERLSESEGGFNIENESKLKRKIKKMLRDLSHGATHSMSEEGRKESSQAPTLEFYILKLLNMSRECVADLSVSSDNISTPNITDLDLGNEKEFNYNYNSESVPLSRFSPKGKELIIENRMKRAADWEETIKKWKTALEGCEEPEDEPDFSRSNRPDGDMENTKLREIENFKPIEKSDAFSSCDSEIINKYDKITRKCSERITQLSNMLEKVRKDKEKLINSTSASSSVSLGKDGKVLEKNFEKEGEKLLKTFREKLCSSLESEESVKLKSFGSFDISQQIEESISNKAVADSQSCQDGSLVSSESLPDVMDELLKREIITSPFKWSEGESSIEVVTNNENLTKPSSIETAIGNFRKEMSKIKPFSTDSTHLNSGTKPRCFFSTDENYDEVFNSSKRCSARRMLFADLPKDSLENKLNSSSNKSYYQEESSVESINHALTSLGLNWAKSFLRKNEQSKAITSSSSSDKSKSSEDEDENYYSPRTNKY